MDLIPIIRPWVGQDEVDALAEVIESGWLAQGPRVEKFERELADHVGADEGVAVSSCTAGLHLALIACDIGPGDEVVVPSLSFIATANAPRYCGAAPVFADVDPVSFNLTADSIEKVVSDRTKAVILVHQLGMPANIAEVRALCDERGLALIEDAACAIGSTYRGQLIGSHSDFVVFSFHPRKLLTTGEGGMVMVRDRRVASRLRRLRQHAMSKSGYDRHASSDRAAFDELGFNYRMTDLQAAVGLIQLRRLGEIVSDRREKAGIYEQLLGHVDLFTTPRDPDFGTTNFQSYAVVLDDRLAGQSDRVRAEMRARGIATRQGVMAIHLEKAYSGLSAGSLPNTERIADRSVTLPLSKDLRADSQELVASALIEAASRAA